jgi:hypothetical protein
MAIKAKGLKGNRVCPAISVSGAFGSGQIYKCAESGDVLNASLEVQLKPFNATAGTPGSFTVSVLDGPDYTYTYRAGAAAAPKAGTAANKIASITSSPCYSAFLGLKDRSPTDEPFSPWRTEMGIKVARTAIDYPGVTIEAAIPGEGDSGVHSPAMLVPGNDLFTLLARSEPPTELFQTGNVYARVTPRFEVALRRKILASKGDLMPADVLRLALDSVKEVSGTASYPLAVLTAHNLLKNATMIGRAAIQDASAQHLPKNPSSQLIALHNSKVAREEQTLCKWSPIVAKLASLRLNPALSKDKMGPWYHGFGILSAGALINGEKARLAMFAEHAGKSLKLFSKEGGFNAEKFALDKEFAATAVHISNEGLRRF